MKVITTLCCAFVLIASTARADEDVLRPRGRGTDWPKVSLGVEGGVNLNFFSQNATGLRDESVYAPFQSGSGVGLLLGAFIDIGFSDVVGLQLGVYFDGKGFGGAGEGVRDCLLNDGLGNLDTVDGRINTEYSRSSSYLTLLPSLRISPTPELFILIGPNISFRLDSVSGTTTMTSLNEDCKFFPGTPNEAQSITTTGKGISENLLVGLTIAVGYKLALTPSISLVPKVGFQFNMSNFLGSSTATEDSRDLTLGTRIATLDPAKLHSLQLSLALWFAL